MSTISVPADTWEEFLREFSQRHHGWLVTIETFDAETEEDVVSGSRVLESIELDTEDEKNQRINVIVRSDNKEIKHILFKPSSVHLHVAQNGGEEAIEIKSVHTTTTVRFRVAITPDLVDGAA